MNIREQAQHIVDARTKATPAPLKAEDMGSEGYALYARPEEVSLRDVHDAIGVHGCIGVIRDGRDWAQLRGNAEYIEAAWNSAPDIARTLIEALDVLERTAEAKMPYVPYYSEAQWYEEIARDFLASLEKEAD